MRRRATGTTRATCRRRSTRLWGRRSTGATFTRAVIVVNGRASDDISMRPGRGRHRQRAGQYMSSSGTFTSTTPSYRTAFLNSPGSPGSNFSYTSPVIPAGTYSVEFRAIDSRDQVSGQCRTSVDRHRGDQPAEQPAGGERHGQRARRTSATSTVVPRPTRTRRR